MKHDAHCRAETVPLYNNDNKEQSLVPWSKESGELKIIHNLKIYALLYKSQCDNVQGLVTVRLYKCSLLVLCKERKGSLKGTGCKQGHEKMYISKKLRISINISNLYLCICVSPQNPLKFPEASAIPFLKI
jgi:hypothetical protein